MACWEADRHVLCKEWSEAESAYQRVLVDIPTCLPALLGLEYVLQWRGSRHGLAEDLAERAREAPMDARHEAEQYFSDRPDDVQRVFLHGRMVDEVCRDFSTAIDLYRRAAERGHVGGQYWVGYCFRNGRGVRRDRHEAFTWVARAAEQGFPLAICDLGHCYWYHGWGAEQDRAYAMTLWIKAAERGCYYAQHELANRFQNGTGVERDVERGAMWRARAERQFAIE